MTKRHPLPVVALLLALGFGFALNIAAPGSADAQIISLSLIHI